ncbi:MAG: hypothetical protein ACK5RE_06555 [Pseudanabaena sp.]
MPLQNYCCVMMGKKRDLKQVDAIANEFHIRGELRESFGEFIEEQKSLGYGGSLNAKRDFTYKELREKAKEFLEDRGI